MFVDDTTLEGRFLCLRDAVLMQPGQPEDSPVRNSSDRGRTKARSCSWDRLAPCSVRGREHLCGKGLGHAGGQEAKHDPAATHTIQAELVPNVASSVLECLNMSLVKRVREVIYSPPLITH